MRNLLICLILIGWLMALYYGNRRLQAWLRPRASFGRFLLYMLAGLALGFAGCFAVVVLISKLFPVPKG